MKIFVTGPSGAGKTTLARKISREEQIPHIDYDECYGYRDVSIKHCRRFLTELPEDCVVDAVPKDPGFDTFDDWASWRTDVGIYCCVLPEREWLLRQPGGGHTLTHEIWLRWWTVYFPTLLHPVNYTNTSATAEKRPLSHKAAMLTVNMASMIRERIDRAPEGLDVKYQDIPEIGCGGYSGSAETWRRIKDLVDWRKCPVVDCGTHYGHMLFRIRDAGCGVGLLGLDRNDYYLATARAVNRLRNDTVEFRQWQAGMNVPPAGVYLCLNALHHFPVDEAPNPRPFLETIAGKMAIFEADAAYGDLLTEYWNKVTTHNSARPNRAIFHCQ